MRHNEKGFTLIELMIVIAIIGILAAVAIPNFLNARGKAQDAAANSTLEAMKTALEMYMASVGSYPTATNPSTLSAAMAATGDWPSNILKNDGGGATVPPGYFTSFAGTTTTYTIGAKGRDETHYFHLTNAGALTGPEAGP